MIRFHYEFNKEEICWKAYFSRDNPSTNSEQVFHVFFPSHIPVEVLEAIQQGLDRLQNAP